MFRVNLRCVSPLIRAKGMSLKMGLVAAAGTPLRRDAGILRLGRPLSYSTQCNTGCSFCGFMTYNDSQLHSNMYAPGKGLGLSTSLLPSRFTISHASIARRRVSRSASTTGSGERRDSPESAENLTEAARPGEFSRKEARAPVSRAADRGRLLVDEIFDFADGSLVDERGRGRGKGGETGRERGSWNTSTWEGLSDDEGEVEEGEEEREVGRERGRAGRGRNEAKRNAKKAKDLGLQLVELRRVDVERIVR